jgi:3-oxosteroid 1-dehydrogenase
MMQDFDEVFDFVVVGSGGGSMCAGLVMRKAGRSVLILEKTDLIGGSTSKAAGVMWIPNNRFMREDGIEDSHEQAAAYLDSVVGDNDDTPGASRERRQAYLREAPAMVDFLVSQGLKLCRVKSWPDYYDERPGGNEPGRTVMAQLFNVNELGAWRSKLRPSLFQVAAPMWEAMDLPMFRIGWRGRRALIKMIWRTLSAKLTGKQWATAGEALQGRMLQAALKAGIEIRNNAPVRELVVENGGVVGVVTQKDGRDWRVGVRSGVLLNAGGFAHDQAMLDKYIPNVRSEWSVAAPGDTGDMHKEMIRVGAAMAQMEEMVGNQMTLPPEVGPQPIQMQLAKPHAFLVDQTGVRYMNESGSYMEFCRNMLARHAQVPAVPSWWIMDSQFIERYMLGSSMPGANKPAGWFTSGYLKKADTIEELAKTCGLDPAALKATTDRFNDFAYKGSDADFHRGDRAYDRWLGDYTHGPNMALGAVEKGPFYAVAVVPGNVGTYGGVVTDAHARVMRPDGSIIAGLYATGTTTASVMGRKYPGAGCSIGPAFTWGYVAAKHAANVGNQPN